MTAGRRRLARLVLLTLATLLVATGCRFEGPGTLPLPFRTGTGDGSIQVGVQLASIANLAPNSEVKVNDLTVGTVTDTQFEDWHAKLTVSLQPGVDLPANATARVGQKSLLGAEYLELAPPTQGAAGQLRDGDVIPLDRTGRYPETEEVLAALSVVLNGGGLNQIQTITRELNAALGGRQSDVRALIGNLGRFVGALDAQRADIIRAIDGLNRLSATLAAQRPVIDEALDTIPAGLKELSDDRDQLVGALTALGNAGDQLNGAVRESGDNLIANLRSLQPAVGRLADAGQNFTESIQYVGTFPFPSRTFFPAVAKGDYANIYAMVDLRPDILARNLLGGFQLPVNAGVLSFPPLAAGNAGPGGLLPALPSGLVPQLTLPGGISPGGLVPTAPASPAAPSSGQGLLPGILGGQN